MKTVRVAINGRTIMVPADVSVAAAVATGTPACFRRSVRGEPRVPLCGMGVCFECRVRINGTPNLRACMTRVCDGMTVDTDD